MSAPKPYYQDEAVTIYHGDCREILPAIKADVLVTDPPYGVNLGTNSNTARHGLAHARYASYDDTYENFIATVVPALNLALDVTCRGAVFTGPHIHEQRKPDAIGGIYCPNAAGRHCWGFKSFLPVLLYGRAPDLHKGSKATGLYSVESTDRSDNDHPVAKPIGWMTWLVTLACRTSDVVVDPFMGSGTTLRACKDLGRRAIGIEIEERYCELAARRMSQSVLFATGAA